MKTELQKTSSELQKKINRLRELCTKYDQRCRLRKRQITKYNLFVAKLISEGRITRSEIDEYMKMKLPYED